MAVKTPYEPKDARITFNEKYYIDDIDQIKREPRKRITGTQALVEFLNTTSPEEFQKVSTTTTTTNKRPSSALFFRRKSTNNNNNKAPMMTTNNNTTNSNSPTTTIHRKNYIEIIANPFTFNKTKLNNSSSSSSNTPTTTAKNNNSSSSSVTIIGSQLNRTLLSKSSTSIYSMHLENNNPVLPIRKKGFGAGTTSGTQTTTTTTRRTPPSLGVSTTITNNHHHHAVVNSILTKSTTLNKDDDIIEGGLKQRLKHYQSLSLDKPSDSISKSLAQEHLAALEVVSSMMIIDKQQQNNNNKRKKKSRHIQVQTMPYYPNENDNDNNNNAVMNEQQQQQQEGEVTCTYNNKLVNDDDNMELLLLQQKLYQMEKELRQEKLISSRLQAALEETCDQFEVLTGLAYKKLREVWEEKTRWENACIEAKEKCWHDHQQQILGPSYDAFDDNDDACSFMDGTVMDFLIDEDMDNEEEYLI